MSFSLTCSDAPAPLRSDLLGKRRQLLHHFYDPFPSVANYREVTTA